jgi:hypothetical protein
MGTIRIRLLELKRIIHEEMGPIHPGKLSYVQNQVTSDSAWLEKAILRTLPKVVYDMGSGAKEISVYQLGEELGIDPDRDLSFLEDTLTQMAEKGLVVFDQFKNVSLQEGYPQIGGSSNLVPFATVQKLWNQLSGGLDPDEVEPEEHEEFIAQIAGQLNTDEDTIRDMVVDWGTSTSLNALSGATKRRPVPAGFEGL